MPPKNKDQQRDSSASRKDSLRSSADGDAPTLTPEQLTLALIEAVSVPEFAQQINKAIDYNKISQVVSEQVSQVVKSLTDKLAVKHAQVNQLHNDYS